MALSANDTAALDKIWADDYEFVTPDGQIQTKSERLESIRSGELKMESITFDEVHVRSYGDAAVVTAKATQKSTNKGKDNSGTSAPLTLTITDQVTTASFTTSAAINIPATVGGNTAYVGFTGGTGGSSATQKILTWTFSNSASSAPAR